MSFWNRINFPSPHFSRNFFLNYSIMNLNFWNFPDFPGLSSRKLASIPADAKIFSYLYNPETSVTIPEFAPKELKTLATFGGFAYFGEETVSETGVRDRKVVGINAVTTERSTNILQFLERYPLPQYAVRKLSKQNRSVSINSQ